MNWETLLCLGDSITIGARSYCGYPEFAGHFLGKEIGNQWSVVNHATCGFTVMDLQRSVTNNFSNLKQFDPGIVTIMIGTNDLKKNTNPEYFRIAYSQLILKAKLLCASRNVLLIKIPYLATKVMYPYNMGMNGGVDRFNAIIEELAREHSVRITQMQFSESDFFDGVHLNDAGAENAGRQLSSYILADRGVNESYNAALRVVNG